MRTKVIKAMRISGISFPPIVRAKTSLGLGQGTVAEDECVAQEEDPHHGFAPGDVLERPLVRRKIGCDAA
jgi:hypothetical protein